MNKLTLVLLCGGLICANSHAQVCSTPTHIWAYSSKLKLVRSIDRQSVETKKYPAEAKDIDLPEEVKGEALEGFTDAIAYFEKNPETRDHAAMLRTAHERQETYTFVADGVPTVISASSVYYRSREVGPYFTGKAGFLMYRFMGKPVYVPCKTDN